jgi:hypothetical protein
LTLSIISTKKAFHRLYVFRQKHLFCRAVGWWEGPALINGTHILSFCLNPDAEAAYGTLYRYSLVHASSKNGINYLV